MKKLLGISLVAVLAATPLMAFAAAGDIDKDPGATVSENAPVAANGPKYGLATSDATDANAASAGYVKGAYNAAIRAINSVDGRIDTINTNMNNKANKDFSNVENGAIAKEKLATGVQTSLGLADSALQKADIVEGTTNGTINVDGDDVAVHGLGSAAYTDSTAYATAAQGALAASALQKADIIEGTTNGTINVDGDDVAVHGLGSAAYTAATAYATAEQGAKADTALQEGNNVSLLTNDAGYLTSTDLSGYATEAGVANTILNHTTLSQGTVTNGALTGDLATTTDTITVMTEWGSTQSKTDKTFVASASKGDLGTNVTVAAPTVASVTYTAQN